jgi:hypothetical protein
MTDKLNTPANIQEAKTQGVYGEPGEFTAWIANMSPRLSDAQIAELTYFRNNARRTGRSS